MQTRSRIVPLLAAATLTALTAQLAAFAASGAAPVLDNVTPTSNAADTFFGHRYEDPYRPLENLADKRVEAWYRAEAKRSEAALAVLPGRDMLVKEWLSLDARTPPKYEDFAVEGGRVFYRKTMPGESVGREKSACSSTHSPTARVRNTRWTASPRPWMAPRSW